MLGSWGDSDLLQHLCTDPSGLHFRSDKPQGPYIRLTLRIQQLKAIPHLHCVSGFKVRTCQERLPLTGSSGSSGSVGEKSLVSELGVAMEICLSLVVNLCMGDFVCFSTVSVVTHYGQGVYRGILWAV